MVVFMISLSALGSLQEWFSGFFLRHPGKVARTLKFRAVKVVLQSAWIPYMR